MMRGLALLALLAWPAVAAADWPQARDVSLSGMASGYLVRPSAWRGEEPLDLGVVLAPGCGLAAGLRVGPNLVAQLGWQVLVMSRVDHLPPLAAHSLVATMRFRLPCRACRAGRLYFDAGGGWLIVDAEEEPGERLARDGGAAFTLFGGAGYERRVADRLWLGPRLVWRAAFYGGGTGGRSTEVSSVSWIGLSLDLAATYRF